MLQWGRRPLLIAGAVGGSLSMLGIAIYIKSLFSPPSSFGEPVHCFAQLTTLLPLPLLLLLLVELLLSVLAEEHP